jgi:7-carboxy-7-deazaguanine synthase
MSEAKLRISEIFYSLQGETTTSGLPTAFIRLTGCPLRCNYCDTEYAFFGGEQYALSQILEQVKGYQPRYVTVTGGEPLAQPNCLPLLSDLCDAGYRVSLETSGALPIADVDQRVVVVLDLKTPASGEAGRNLWENLPHLKPGDEIKFVICDRPDYEWVRLKLDQYNLNDGRFELLFSPSQGELEPAQLAEWIMADNLPVRLQIQLHKQLWGDKPGT